MNATKPISSFVLESHDVILTICSYSLNTILGFPLNVCVVWLILAGARDTLASDLFSLNLAMSEIFFTSSFIWYYAAVRLESYLCLSAFIFLRSLIFTGRPLFLCCICVEYYIGVVHPVLFLQLKPLRYRVACCCVVWLMILVSCLSSLYTYLDSFYLYGFFIQNILIFSVMLFCCGSVLRALKRPGPGGKDTEKKKCNTTKRRAFKILLLIMISLVFNFLLMTVVIPLQCCLSDVEFSSVYTICTCIALATGFIQPLLYLHRTGKLLCFKKP